MQSPQVSVLVVDNYDSFVYTLVGYLEQLGARTTVIRNDGVTPARALELAAEHTAVLISPGPARPPTPVSPSTSSAPQPTAAARSSGCAWGTRPSRRCSAPP